MLCEKYLALQDTEQAVWLAKIIHVLQHDNLGFECGNDLIELGERKALFKNVKFYPEENNIDNNKNY